ncbi:DUF3228 family protein [bacterium]|nr:DUF3228 family protein [bacterium]
MSIATTKFAAGRHFNPDFAGTKIASHSPAGFDAFLDGAHFVEGAKAGFVKHVFVRNFTDAMSGVAKITDANRHHLRSEYRARREGELPVLTRWFPKGTVVVERCEWLHLVLYSREQLAAEGMEIEADWGIVSINSATAPEAAPLGPAAQMRNALGTEQGGNGKPLDPEAYAAGVAYWNQWATVG